MVKRLGVLVLALSFVTGVAWGGVSGYRGLVKFLTDLPGWAGEKPDGMTMDSPQGRMITATRNYKKGEKTFSLAILVGGSATMAMAPIQMGMSMETPEVLMKTISFKGFRAGVNYNKKEREGGIVVQLSTQNPPAALVVNFHAMDYRDALDLLDHFDVKGMASALK